MRTLCGVLLLLTLGLAGCGDSDDNAATQTPEEKAQATVCNARADIKKQVDELKALTVSTVTIDGVKQNLDAIKNDLKAISGAQKDLSSDRRAEVEAATKAFASSVESIAAKAVTSLSLGDAKAALVDALQNLGQSFEDSFAPLNCD
ncbi:MAG TPA: hypothetical protein VFM58_11225 [Solirubrobacteraceae bacterium]|nr:hypothetical protein [Solirubrobacteraceae bacterium]